MGVAAVLDVERPVVTVVRRAEPGVALGADEVRQHVVVAPARGAVLVAPGVVVGPVPADVDHRVHRRAAAERLHPRPVGPSVVQLLLLGGGVVPVPARLEQRREGHRDRDLVGLGLGSGLEQQHPHARVLAQPGGEHGAGAACPDDDVVVPCRARACLRHGTSVCSTPLSMYARCGLVPNLYPARRRGGRVFFPVQTREDRDTCERGHLRACSDRPHLGCVPVRREPPDADARRRPAAVREAGGRAARLRPPDLRADVEVDEIAPLFLKRPTRGITTAGQWVWTQDDNFDLEYHFRHSALPKPGRVRELLELCSRLHSTRLARERPLWEAHLIEGLRDGRVALYTKMHHSLVDGISAMRLLQSVMTTDPDKRDMPADVGGPAEREDREGPDGGRAQPGRRTPGRDAYGARHHRRRRRAAGRPGQDAEAAA